MQEITPQPAARFAILPIFLRMLTYCVLSISILLLIGIGDCYRLQAQEKGSHDDVFEYKVKKNDTLSKISKQFLEDPGRWKELLKYNEIPNPSLIREGITLKIPGYLRKDSIPAEPVQTSVTPIENPEAIAEFVIGTAESSKNFNPATNTEKWTKIVKNATFLTDEWIRTKDKSSLRFAFIKTGISFEVRQNSVLRILSSNKTQSLAEYKNNTVENAKAVLVSSGSLESSVREKDKSKKYKLFVVTPVATVGVRGTEFYVDSTTPDKSTVGCFQGELDVGAQGVIVHVPAGFGTSVEKGKKPTTPTPLPDRVEIE
ncbi:sigma factor regulatory protein, FecR/PupR family [Leptospira inadai serovar Lyme str. 10]|uniref:Sigma factor regulatory protein, FecR/PupR family n=2 Tax=Leptospira inadai serovar Lyme TaxID=293084 RepID=V6HA54_9LEPT|nr:LysM peptidoglycan-binding domain-containing protein [Leptospira inadai]EQA36211.1 sigma factor regulatory protein, FecR/PupR family [Leptospira inadai serovar Lyme str. 10]PNV74809.1 LysM peptidoglycan-binding domain-containing protein [Leptospira inadai serovar Lyme]